MSEAIQPDAMKNLVKFLVCLAILGMILALATYFGLILPSQQATVHPPANLYMQVF
nr:hypothetical protein [uncultured Methanoregula sp.]